MTKRQWAGSKTGTLTGNWLGASSPIDYDIRTGLRVLRARAREQSQNSDHVKGFVRMVSSNVIGPAGIILQGKVRTRSGKPDQRSNAAIEEHWQTWGKRGSCEISGRFSWRLLQRHVIQTVARDGEALIRFLPTLNRYGLALQVIDPETLDIDFNEVRPNSEVRMGVEIDSYHRPMAYYFTPEPAPTQGSYNSALGGKRTRIRVPAEEILHVYLPEYVWQSRGIPWVATGLLRLYMLQGYEDAEVTAARIAASKMGFYTPAADAPDWSGKQENGDFVQDLSPGQMDILPPGYTFQAFDPQHPAAQFGVFVKSCLRSISTGLGVSYNTLANDLEGVNYSSLRHGMIAERDLWMELQDWFIESFCDPIYNRWIADQLKMDTITASNGRPIPIERASEYARVAWQPRRWPWVDPEKEISANEKAIALNLRSRSEIIRETGRDPEEVFTEIAEERELMKSLGLQPDIEDQGNAKKDQTEEKPEDETEPEADKE